MAHPGRNLGGDCGHHFALLLIDSRDRFGKRGRSFLGLIAFQPPPPVCGSFTVNTASILRLPTVLVGLLMIIGMIGS